MKRYLIAAGVTSLLIAAQAMASDAAGLSGAPETAGATETASAPRSAVGGEYLAVEGAHTSVLRMSEVDHVSGPPVIQDRVVQERSALVEITRNPDFVNERLDNASVSVRDCAAKKRKSKSLVGFDVTEFEAARDYCGYDSSGTSQVVSRSVIMIGAGVAAGILVTVNDDPASS